MRVIVVVSFAMVMSGCTSLMTPPPTPAPAKSLPVYLVNYGYHASLLVPDGEQDYSEYAYGDWAWFAEGKKGSASGVRAFLFSFKSGLGRRRFRFAQPPSSASLLEELEAMDVIQFSLDADRVQSFVTRIDRGYATAAVREVRFNQLNQMHFVPWPEHYWLFHNCNHATASWLKELGIAVSGLHATSDFRVRREFKGRVTEARSEPADRGPTGVPVRRVESPADTPGAPASQPAH